MIWIMGSLVAAGLTVSCGRTQTDDQIRVAVWDAVPQGNVDYREPPPVSDLPQLPDRPLARHEVAAAKRVVLQVGESLLDERGRTEMVNLADSADTSAGDRIIPRGWQPQPSDPMQTFTAWLEEQGCIARSSTPTASAEGITAHLVLTSSPPQLPISIDFRVRSEDGSTTTETHQLRVRLGSVFGMVPVE